MCWSIESFLEDPQNPKNVRQNLTDFLNLNSIPRQTEEIIQSSTGTKSAYFT